MEKEFILYEQSLALKELGFDEPCFGFYYINPLNSSYRELKYGMSIFKKTSVEITKGHILAPTFSQAFRWFREKYNLQCSINFYSESLGIKKVPNHYEIQIDYLSNNKWCYFENVNNKIYLTYKEAELECLKKLIEIVKNKQNV